MRTKYSEGHLSLHTVTFRHLRYFIPERTILLEKLIVFQTANKFPSSQVKTVFTFFMFLEGAFRYIFAINANLMPYLSPVYFVNQPLHVLGIFVSHHQEVYCIYIYIYIYTHTHTHTTIRTCCAF